MVLQFAFHIILILCSLHTLSSAQQDTSIAQPGCDSRCGSVDIPYPFGMNARKCYADKWFEIQCRNTSDEGQTPYLKSIDVEVSYIDLRDATISIMNPIYHWNCGELKDGQQVLDLRGSPFVYSQDWNKFVSVGCNKMAFFMSNGTQVSGCVSICDDNESRDMDLATDRCNGKSCCQTSLPMYLSEYNVTTQNLGNNRLSDQCNYALIVAENYVSQDFRDFRDLKYADAMLEWEITLEIILNSTVNKLPASNCRKTNVTSSQYGHSGWRCYCDLGSDGNPYIDGGCIIIRRMIPFPTAFKKNIYH